MSASERLKALTDRERENDYPGRVRDVLEEALPQIVAVVEAAEDTEYATDPEWPLHAALSALNEALA